MEESEVLMPFQLIRDDISKVSADAIVNSANPEPTVGRGSDMAVFNAAGYEQLLKERQKIGSIKPGETAVTEAFALHAKYIIHTVGPIWQDGEHREMETLASCYRKSLQLAKHLKCASIAFPLISSGVYGFPKDKALSVALKEIEAFLADEDMDVTLVVFDRQSYQISAELNHSVREYISDRIAQETFDAEYSRPAMLSKPQFRENQVNSAIRPQSAKPLFRDRKKKKAAPAAVTYSELPSPSIQEILRSPAKTFQEQLLFLIDEKGYTDVEVYKKANLDRKLFSKIRSNPDYVPKKKTALALAVALELTLDETKDLLSRASLALSPSSPFDLIIEYCISHQNYNIIEINSILFEYDQQLLGY